MSTVSITYNDAWRSPAWAEYVESRPAWFLRCSEHGPLSNGWGFAESWRAQGSATRHLRSYHRDEVQVIRWFGRAWGA